MQVTPGSTERADWHRLTGLCLAVVTIALLLPAVADAASPWQLTQLPAKVLEGGYHDQAMLSGVDCPTESLCVAVGSFGTIATSTSPASGASAWKVAYPTAPGKGANTDVSCASEQLCVVVGFEGGVLVSTDPTGGAAAWSMTNVNLAHDNAIHLTGVSCPSTTLCVAVNGANPGGPAGKILTTTEPTAGQWQVAQLDDSLHFTGVSCASPTACVAVARGGKIAVSSDPTGGPAAWSVIDAPGGAGDLEGIDCIPALCAAGNATGQIITSTDPTGGAPWREAKAGTAALVTGVSCPTATDCVGVDNNGSVFTSNDPTGGSGAWNAENLVPFEASESEGQFVHNALFGASCASTSLCALVGSDSRIFISTTPFATAPGTGGGGSGGKAPPVDHAPARPKAFLVFAENFWRITATRHRRVRTRFHFYSPTATKGFECKRDRGRWRRCRSPLRYWVDIGHHALRVRAIGPTGLRGPVAVLHFRVVRRREAAAVWASNCSWTVG
jgi:hypothetical protein